MQTSETLVFFAADPGYAFPVIAAIRSFRENGGCDDVDVALLAVDFPEDQLARIAAVLAPQRVAVTPVASTSFVPMGATVQSGNPAFEHLTDASLVRLVASRHVPDRYTHALYIDADCWCLGGIRELLQSPPRPGKLHAAPDPINFYKRHLGNVGSATRAYLAGIGLPLDRTYFNSGVLWGDVGAWRALGEKALAYYFAHPKACRLADQSALNAIGQDGGLAPMSLRWNGATQLRLWNAEAIIAPRISHFAGPGKPWLGSVAPWQDFALRFDALCEDPAIAAFAPAKALPEQIARIARHPRRGSLKAETLDRFREMRIRAAIRAWERAAPF